MTDLPMLRTSERKDFKRCVKRWDWRWRQGLVPRQQKYGALWFGTGIHLALEHWYIPGKTRGVDPRETWDEFVGGRIEFVKAETVSGEATDETVEVWVQAGELGHAMLTNYLDTYGKDESWEVISAEQTFQVLVPRPGTRTPIVNYVGTFDLVARDLDTGHIFLWDHKTAKAIRTGHLPLDDQAGSYWAVATHVLRRQGLMTPKQQIRGIVYNFLMKSPPDDRPKDELGRARNKPEKKHYVGALLAADGFTVEGDPNLATARKLREKQTLAELMSSAHNRGLTVLGDVSKAQPSKRFERTTVFRSAKERATQIERIGAEAVVMDQFRTHQLPLIKNPTSDCQWDCDFRNLCELDEQGGDTESFIDQIYVQEDPYAAHDDFERREQA